jgi:hypothetical protein
MHSFVKPQIKHYSKFPSQRNVLALENTKLPQKPKKEVPVVSKGFTQDIERGKNPIIVVFYGGGPLPTSEGVGLPHIANRVGDFAKADYNFFCRMLSNFYNIRSDQMRC